MFRSLTPICRSLALLSIVFAAHGQEASLAPGKARPLLSDIPSFAFSQREAFVLSKDGTGYLSNPAAGIENVPFLDGVYRSFGFSHDGQHFLYLRSQGRLPGFTLYAYYLGARTEQAVSAGRVVYAAWSPSSLKIAYMEFRDDSRLVLRIQDLRSGTVKEVGGGMFDAEWLEWSADGGELRYVSVEPETRDAIHENAYRRTLHRYSVESGTDKIDDGEAPAAKSADQYAATASGSVTRKFTATGVEYRYAAQSSTGSQTLSAGAGYSLPYQGSAYLVQGGTLFSGGACDGSTCLAGAHKNLLGYGLDWQQMPENGMGGKQILAVADGTVAAIYNTVTCNSVTTSCNIGWDNYASPCNDPNFGAGNYVVIAHADGSYSLYAHLRSGSVRVTPGQTVLRGDYIADQGHSGSAGTYNNYLNCGEHVHFQRQTSAVVWGQSIPTDFNEIPCSLSCGTAYLSQNVQNRGPAAALTVVLAPKALQSGSSSQGNQVVLPTVAPAGGAVVTLASSDPATASVPASVTVPAGAASAAFPVNALQTSPAAITISASWNGSTASDTLTVGGVGVALLQLPTARVSGATPIPGIQVTLTAAAPAGGTVVAITSSSSNLVVPSSITVPAGSTSGTFDATTLLVPASTTALLTVSAGGTSQSATVYIDPLVLKTLNIGSTPLGGGNSTSGVIVLSGSAPPGGAVVTMTSSDPSVSVPATVTVPAGATSVTYPISTTTVTASTTSNITATYGNTTLAGVFTVNPIALVGFTLSPTSVIAGRPSSYNGLTLNYPAPPGGAVISFTSSNPAAIPPSTLTMAAGARLSPNFAIQSGDVPATTQATITASYAGSSVSQVLTIEPLSPSSLTVNAATVGGGNSITGNRLAINSAALGSGATVQLTSSDPSVAVPATLVIPTGLTAVLFTITTSPVAVSTPVTITATLNGVSRTASLTVNPIVVSTVNLANANLGGGITQGSNTVTLTYPAPVGGAAVALSSSNPSVAAVPASVTVAQNATVSPAFNITTSPVASPTQVTISATYAGVKVDSVLTVNPAAVSTVNLQPARLAGGLSSVASVVLNGAAPTGGAVVALSSSNPSVAPVPANITVAAGGTTSPNFTIVTTAVSATTPVTISATFGGVTKTATLTVDPTQVAALTLSPTSVGSGNSTAANTITLNGPAPAGGASVTLVSSNPSVASPPATVVVPAGATTSPAFSISTAAGQVTQANVTITASYGGASASGVLTVNPLALVGFALGVSNVGGGGTVSGNTVTLVDNAIAPGAVVTLSSSNPSVAGTPASVTVAAGTKSATFNITTSPVTTSTPVTISATFGSTTLTAVLTVTPPALSNLVLTTVRTGGGLPVNGNTVALNGPAPSGGAVVTLTSSDPTAASVPASVTIPAGSSGPVSFDIATYAVTSGRSAVITASFAGGSKSVTLNIDPIVVSRISISGSMGGGNATTSNVAVLNYVAPPGGLTLNLTSSNPAVASVPATVTVPAGVTISNPFTITSYPVTANTNVTIAASLPGSSASSVVLVFPVVLDQLFVNPTSLIAGNPGTYNSVKINTPAPAGGAVVQLSSSDPAASVPASVTVAQGQTYSPYFWVTTSAVSAPVTATITASFGGVTKTGTVTVNPIVPTSLTVGSGSIAGGATITGCRLALNSRALGSGAVVALSSSDPSVTPPATVTIPAGSSAVLFTTFTSAVTAPKTVTVTATYNGVSQTATVTVNPILPAAVNLAATSVTGGTATSGTVRLNFAAPAPVVVSLSSSNPAVVVPGSVTVNTNQTLSPTFAISTSAVASSTPVTITATYNGGSASAVLTVQ